MSMSLKNEPATDWWRCQIGKERIFIERMTSDRKLRRPERARNEGTTGPKRLDDIGSAANLGTAANLTAVPFSLRGPTWRTIDVQTSCTPLQGYLAHKKRRPPLGPPQGPRHSPTVGSYVGAVSFERGTLVLTPPRVHVRREGPEDPSIEHSINVS